MLTVRQVAQQLKVATATVYALCSQGRLDHIRVGAAGRGTIRIREEDLAVFIDMAMVRLDDRGKPKPRRT